VGQPVAPRLLHAFELTRERVSADWYILDGVLEDEGELTFAAGVDVEHGVPVIALREAPLPVRVGPERAG
jgi:hypothetical protein